MPKEKDSLRAFPYSKPAIRKGSRKPDKPISQVFKNMDERLRQLELWVEKHGQALIAQQSHAIGLVDGTDPRLPRSPSALRPRSDSAIPETPMNSPANEMQSSTILLHQDGLPTMSSIENDRRGTVKEHHVEHIGTTYTNGLDTEHDRAALSSPSDAPLVHDDNSGFQYGFITVPADLEDTTVAQSPQVATAAVLTVDEFHPGRGQNACFEVDVDRPWNMTNEPYSLCGWRNYDESSCTELPDEVMGWSNDEYRV